MRTAVAPDEGALIEALRRGDERAFMGLVDRHHALMVRVARGYVRSDAVAEEVAQDAWVGFLSGIERFEARSSLKTFLFRILVNRALTRATREARTVPFSALAGEDQDEPAVGPDRFLDASHPRWGPEEVCDALGISDGNQRILLHRARSKVRAALERYLDPQVPA